MVKTGRHLNIGAKTIMALASLTFLLLNVSPARAATPADTPAKTPAKTVSPQETKIPAGSNLLAAPSSLAIDVTAAMQDRVIGDANAPVTITEYASLTCPHCAHFDTEILPELKKELLDTGKAKLIYRDFPLDKLALKAAMMARCVSPLKYFDMIDVIFANQDHWIRAKDPMNALAQLGSLAGMDASQFKACTDNKELEKAILANMQKAEHDDKIDSTPTFIFNNGAARFSGAYPVSKFKDVIAGLKKGN